MPVDRGGINYPITSSYDPSGVAAFRADIAALLNSLGDLRTTLNGFRATINIRPPAAAAPAAALERETLLARQLSAAYRQLAIDKADVNTAAKDNSLAALQGQLLTVEQRMAVAEQRLSNKLTKTDKEFRELDIKRQVAQIERESATLEERRVVAIDKATSAAERLRAKVVAITSAQSPAGAPTGPFGAPGFGAVPVTQGNPFASQLAAIGASAGSPFFAAGFGAGTQGNPFAAQIAAIRTQAQATIPVVQKLQNTPPTKPTYIDQLKKVGSAILGSNDQASRLFDTFERLFVRVTIIAGIRAVARQFRAFVGEMISFNATTENAILGVSSLLLALGNMKDAAGDDTNNIRGFALAQAEATKQTQLLRVDALKTASTFENLVKVFQTAIGPGLQAGLNLDEIRKFTVSISQAAGAIGLPQNQLAEEIRSLLAGTINVRNTKIATALGITNADIRNAKETGTLVDFLSKKFEAFSTAGEAALGTFTVILSNLKDAFAQIIGTGGSQFFETVKATLSDIGKQLFSISETTGLLTANPKAVFIVKQIADVLQDVIGKLKQIFQNFGFEGILQGVKGLALVLSTGFEILNGAIQGTIAAGRDLAGIFNTISDIVTAIIGKDLLKGLGISNIVAGFVEFKLVMAALSFVFAGVVGLATTLLTTLSAIGAPVLLVALAIGLAAGFLRRLASDAIGVDLSFKTLAVLIKDGLIGAFESVRLFATKEFDLIVSTTKIGFLQLKDVILFAFNTVFVFARKEAGLFLETLGKGIQDSGLDDELGGALDLLGTQLKIDANNQAVIDASNHRIRMQAIADEKAALKDRNEQNKKDSEDLAKRLDESAARALKKNIPGSFGFGGLGESLKEGREAFNKFSTGFFGAFPADLGKVNQGVVSFSDSFERLPGIINQTLQSFRDLGKTLFDLNEEAIKAAEALSEGLQVLQLTGNILAERKNFFDAENKTRILQKELVTDEKGQQELLLGIQVRRAAVEEKILALTDEQQDKVGQATAEAFKSLILLEKIAETEAERRALENQLDTAKVRNDPIEIQRLEKRLQINKQLLDTQQVAIGVIKENSDSLLFDVENGKELVELVEDRVFLGGTEKNIQATLATIAADKLLIEQKLLQIVNKKNTLLATQHALELQRTNEIAAIVLANDQRLFGATSLKGPPALPEVQSLIQAENALVLLKAQTAQAQALRDIELKHAEVLVQIIALHIVDLTIARDLTTNATDRLEKDKQIADASLALNAQKRLFGKLQDQNNTKSAEEAVNIAKSAEAAQHARDIIERPLQTGFIDGIRQAIAGLPSLYQSTVDVIKNIITGFSDFIATSIVDAFDPTKDTTILERFAQFLQQIAKQVIQMFINLALVRAALSLGFLGTGGVPGGGLPGGGFFGGLFAQGGLLPGNNGAVARDNMVIGAQSGEFMQPVRSVAMYGADFMESLRQGLVDPFTLRAAAGMGRMRGTIRASGKRSFASGGLVGGGGSLGGGSGPAPAYIVANDAAVDKLLAGGKTAFFNFLSSNRGRLRGILGS